MRGSLEPASLLGGDGIFFVSAGQAAFWMRLKRLEEILSAKGVAEALAERARG